MLSAFGCDQAADEPSGGETPAAKSSPEPDTGESGERDARKKALKRRIDAYFNAERRGDWRAVYEMRSPAFRKAVPFVSFERERSRFRKTWEISDWEVRSIELDDGHAMATIVLNGSTTEPTLIYMSGKDRAEFRNTLKTRWIQREGTWFCLDEGVRFGSPFGIDIRIDTEFESDYQWEFERPEMPPLPEPGGNKG